MYQSLIRSRRDQRFKIYKLKGNLSWLRVLQTVCNLYFYYYFIIIYEFEFNDLKYCVLIFVLNLNIKYFLSISDNVIEEIMDIFSVFSSGNKRVSSEFSHFEMNLSFERLLSFRLLSF